MQGVFSTPHQRIITRIRVPSLDRSERDDAGDPTSSLSAQDTINPCAAPVIGVSNLENASFDSIHARHLPVPDPRVLNTTDDPAVLTNSFDEPLGVIDDSQRPPTHSIDVIGQDIVTSVADVIISNTNPSLQSEGAHSQSTASSVRIMIYMYSQNLTSS